MHITLLSPLFPPDTGTPAAYVKELVTRLSADSVDLAIYGHLPEHVPAIRYHCIDKRSILPVRLFRFTNMIHRLTAHTDVFLVQNGPSVELPALLVSVVTSTPIVLCISDARAATAATQKPLYGFIHQMLQKRAHCVISLIDDATDTQKIVRPLARPEILPEGFAQTNPAAFDASWEAHTKALTTVLHHVCT